LSSFIYCGNMKFYVIYCAHVDGWRSSDTSCIPHVNTLLWNHTHTWFRGSSRRGCFCWSCCTFSFGFPNSDKLINGKVVGCNTCVVNFFKSDYNRISILTTFSNGGNGATFLKPIRFWSHDSNLRSSLYFIHHYLKFAHGWSCSNLCFVIHLGRNILCKQHCLSLCNMLL